MVWQSASALAGAVAQSLAFTGTAPLIPGGGPSVVRVCLAISLIPLLWHAAPRRAPADIVDSMVFGAVEGALLGMSASIIAGAVKGAADLIDAALGSPPFAMHGPRGGPIERLYQLVYALVLVESGGFTAMVAELTRGSSDLPRLLFAHYGCIVLATASIREGLHLAGPCLFAQALATISAGLVARASPGLGGVLFGTSFSSAFVLLALVAGASTLTQEMLALVREIVGFSSSVVR